MISPIMLIGVDPVHGVMKAMGPGMVAAADHVQPNHVFRVFDATICQTESTGKQQGQTGKSTEIRLDVIFLGLKIYLTYSDLSNPVQHRSKTENSGHRKEKNKNGSLKNPYVVNRFVQLLEPKNTVAKLNTSYLSVVLFRKKK